MTVRDVLRELQTIIERDIDNAPRTLQTALGPSEIGNACDRCLIHLLAGTPQVRQATPWLPFVGTCVHDGLEMALIRHEIRRAEQGQQSAEWFAEGKVAVGELRGVPITGHTDVFHVPTGTVIDYKLVGTATMKKVKADGSGASLTYQRQAHLYGRGWAAAGFPVRDVAIWFLPRNGLSLAGARVFTEPYNEQVALDALARANQFAGWVDMFGAGAVLAGAPPHTGDEFSCDTYPDSNRLSASGSPTTNTTASLINI